MVLDIEIIYDKQHSVYTASVIQYVGLISEGFTEQEVLDDLRALYHEFKEMGELKENVNPSFVWEEGETERFIVKHTTLRVD